MSDVSKEALVQNMMKNAIPERETVYLLVSLNTALAIFDDKIKHESHSKNPLK